MKLIIIFLALIPTLVEAWLDRHGENRTGKTKDTLWLIIAILALSLAVLWLFDTNPLKTLALVLGWRILLFDYLVTWLLIRNKVIEDPDARWWSYTGKTARFDKLVAKIPWRWRLVIRIVLFGSALAFFLKVGP